MQTAEAEPFWNKRSACLWITVILVVAALLRASTLAFGLPSLNDQDELMFEMGAIKMLRGATLDPGWFGHPATTTMYALALVDIIVFLACRLLGWFPNVKDFADAVFADPTWVILPGRAMIMGFGLWTIALTFRIGQRTGGLTAGLFAAGLLAIAPLHVAYSQIIRSDMMACAFMLLAILQAQRAARGEGGLGSYIWAGLWIGVAVATKWPFALVILAPCGAAALRWREGDWGGLPQLAKRCLAVGLAALAALFLTSPFLIIDWQTVVQNLHGETRAYHLGATGGSFVWNGWWYLTTPLYGSLGPVGLALAAAGCCLLALRREARFVLLPVMLAFVVLFCGQNLVWARWILPLLPFLAIAAGDALSFLCRALRRRGRAQPAAALFASLAALTAAPPIAWSLADGRERMNDTRQQASRWLMSHVPPGKVVLLEHFGFDLINAPYHFRWPVGDAGCVDPLTLIRDNASYQVIEKQRGLRANIDYGSVAQDKIANCRADFAIITHYDRYAAERQRFPNEYATYKRLLDGARTLAIFRPERGVSGGWVIRVLELRQVGEAQSHSMRSPTSG
jgi:hypothetical protein